MLGRQFTVLIVDDEEDIRNSLKRLLVRAYSSEIDLLFEGDGKEALKILETKRVDLSIIDLRMPEMDGFSLLKEIKKNFNSVDVLILTGNGNVKDAVKAIGMGAADFLEKPFLNEEIRSRVEHFYKIWTLKEENSRLREEIAFTFGYEKLVGTAPTMLAIKRLISQAGPSDANILIQGETGTGKELVARALHYQSDRKHEIFVPVDCASLSSSVVESELFGYVKGAFTGAVSSAQGLIRAADGGTIFFDEIGELPLSMQVKLLRVLQEKEVRPIGGTRTFPVNIRLLAATNRNLEEEVAAGRFREDLFYRLNVILLTVPALHDRVEDIPTLAGYFLSKRNMSTVALGISEDALLCLERYNWPGNVRELENVLLRASALRGGDKIEVEDLPPQIRNIPNFVTSECPDSLIPEAEHVQSMESYELSALKNALKESKG
ncbi:MAG: sigma-54 dependent transcriptional regulator, partial [Spirochaetia bacterium]|nr:sigma-54 dependent transcriptional regulator [Spirochaetia bacterium]